ncbi:hypothetical protein TNCV_4657761 [Trichonephila clavipes]|nr:hypothetical protein TNCV_4657761 [Trichonephila clavipes]
MNLDSSVKSAKVYCCLLLETHAIAQDKQIIFCRPSGHRIFIPTLIPQSDPTARHIEASNDNPISIHTMPLYPNKSSRRKEIINVDDSSFRNSSGLDIETLSHIPRFHEIGSCDDVMSRGTWQ